MFSVLVMGIMRVPFRRVMLLVPIAVTSVLTFILAVTTTISFARSFGRTVSVGHVLMRLRTDGRRVRGVRRHLGSTSRRVRSELGSTSRNIRRQLGHTSRKMRRELRSDCLLCRRHGRVGTTRGRAEGRLCLTGVRRRHDRQGRRLARLSRGIRTLLHAIQLRGRTRRSRSGKG